MVWRACGYVSPLPQKCSVITRYSCPVTAKIFLVLSLGKKKILKIWYKGYDVWRLVMGFQKAEG